MGIMTDMDKSRFRREISSQSVEYLSELFNKLNGQKDSDRFSDHARAVAAEKAQIVQSCLSIRKAGGAWG